MRWIVALRYVELSQIIKQLLYFKCNFKSKWEMRIVLAILNII